MESRPAILHPPRNDEPKACWESESKPSGQHRKGNISPGTRTRLGENHGIEVEAKELEERSNSMESAGHVKTLKHTALATNPVSEPLPASRIPTMHSATTKQVTVRTVNTTAITKIASNQPTKATAPGVEVLSLSTQPQPSGPKLRSPNASHEKKLQASAKTFSKNIQKTASASHIMGSADSPQKMLHKTASASQISSNDSPKSLNRASLSQIPRATSSPKLKLSHPASLKLDKTERIKRVTGKEGPFSTSPKDKMIDTPLLVESKLQLGAKAAGESPQGRQEQETKSRIERKGETLGDEREDTVPQGHGGRVLTVKSSPGCKQTSALSSKQAAEPQKEPEDKTDAYVTTQERHAGSSQRRKEKEEAKSEARRQTGERKGEVEIKDKMVTEARKDTVMNEKDKTPTSKQLNDAETETIKGFLADKTATSKQLNDAETKAIKVVQVDKTPTSKQLNDPETKTINVVQVDKTPVTPTSQQLNDAETKAIKAVQVDKTPTSKQLNDAETKTINVVQVDKTPTSKQLNDAETKAIKVVQVDKTPTSKQLNDAETKTINVVQVDKTPVTPTSQQLNDAETKAIKAVQVDKTPTSKQLNDPETKTINVFQVDKTPTSQQLNDAETKAIKAVQVDKTPTSKQLNDPETKTINVFQVDKKSTSKQLNNAETKTIKGFLVTETKDAALQVDLHPVYVDVEVQAVMEVCSKSTDMSPVHDSQYLKLNPEIDLNPKVGLNKDLRPDSNSDSDWLPTVDLRPTGAKPRFLGPAPYKSPNSPKPLQHVCQIEIELCSQSPQSLDSKVTIGELDTTCRLLPGVMNKSSEDSLKPLNAGGTGEVEGEKEESGAPQQVIWDEQGMTWEVYGASLDMESLGFAIQNHLQCKIREHERRISTLRNSICLSEQLPEKGRTGKRKKSVFRSLFSGSNCCSKPQPKEELPK
ncbi:G protein-regulated inducer of neurite outgrowth 3 isoform X2 [Pimephales promelas]|uniref:G protein-regulated inducer of neurite outgrowth 3 isoform X2 n=1 Tax=Pimephales promelas TaxID=90988 RepID=UPI001955EF83|nr:G protein-regulated inducer of neurite outgrowth 3 isoform X2 [Pimephales promelas]